MDQEKETNPKKLRISKYIFKQVMRVVVLLLTIVLMIGAVLLVVYRDEVNLDMFKRYLSYYTLEKDEKGQTGDFVFSGDSSNSFATLSGELLLSSPSTLQLFSSSGEELLNQAVSMEQPAIVSAGSYAVVYDIGGNDLYVIHGEKEVFTYQTAGNYGIISAWIDSDGYFVIAEEIAGYKAAVTVYNSLCSKVMRANISSNFVMDAVLSADHRRLAVVLAGQKSGSFAGMLNLYQCSDASLLQAVQVTDSPILDIKWDSNGIWLQTEHSVLVTDNDGKQTGGWTDENRYLHNFSLNGDGYAVQLYSRYKAGSVGQLMVVDESGDAYASRSVQEEVLSVSAAGRYIAVLTANRLTIYTRDLEEYASVANKDARKVIMRTDGSAMVIAAESARLLVP